MSKKIKRIYLLSFLFTLHISISAYINSTFLTEIINEKLVGIIYVISLILLSKSSKLLENLGNKKTTIIFLMMNILSLYSLSFSYNPYIIGLAFIIFTVTNSLIFFCIDIFIEHFSNSKNTGRTRGLYLTIINIAWMFSPIFTALILNNKSEFRNIYFISLIMVCIVTIGIILFTKKFKDSIYKKTPFLKTLLSLKNNKNILPIVAINFLLQFFYALMVIYTPIYLFEHLGFNWIQIGIIFTIMLSPFVLLGFPIGIMIDKYKINKNKLLNIGFIFIIISTSIVSFLTSSNIFIWAIVLFLTRIGASIIETTGEIHFFSKIEEKDTSLISIYRDMGSVSYLIAPVLTTLLFIFIPFKFIFLILSLIMISGFYFIKKIKTN
jgi:MFS family permease